MRLLSNSETQQINGGCWCIITQTAGLVSMYGAMLGAPIFRIYTTATKTSVFLVNEKVGSPISPLWVGAGIGSAVGALGGAALGTYLYFQQEE